ncbi:MAG: ATP-binding protein [Hyphomicrobium sp.]|jgi:hypothetical protein
MVSINALPDLTCICGPPGSGKTTTAKEVVREAYAAKMISYCVVFTPNADEWKNVLPACHSELVMPYSLAALARVIKQQISEEDESKRHRALIIMDDPLGRVDFGHHIVASALTNYRHHGLSYWLLVQNITRYLPPLVRDCTSRVLVFPQKTEYSLVAIFKAFGTAIWPNKATFQLYLESACKKASGRAFVVIDVKTGTASTAAVTLPAVAMLSEKSHNSHTTPVKSPAKIL